MKLSEWDKSRNAYEMLAFYREFNAPTFTRKAQKIHKYLLACAKKFLRFRCNQINHAGLMNAEKRLRRFVNVQDFHHQEWLIEAQAFASDIGQSEDFPYPYRFDEYRSNDLKKVRMTYGFNCNDAKQYLMDLAYFIDQCMAYSRDSVGELPNQEFAKFLCPDLLRRQLKYPSKS